MLLNDVHPNPEHAAHELLNYFASLPGLGLVKGGFLAQLVFGLVGCIDTHNLTRFNVRPYDVAARAFKSAKTSATRNRKIEVYLDICAKLGGCAALWDGWCEYVYARNRGDYYTSAQQVSQMHVDAIVNT
jgi:hypothetical protein